MEESAKNNLENRIPDDNQQVPEQSPAQKLGDDPQSGPIVPGAEDPDSDEIKQEKNPNTE